MTHLWHYNNQEGSTPQYNACNYHKCERSSLVIEINKNKKPNVLFIFCSFCSYFISHKSFACLFWQRKRTYNYYYITKTIARKSKMGMRSAVLNIKLANGKFITFTFELNIKLRLFEWNERTKKNVMHSWKSLCS